jgi:phenylalanyl-tRNA synthetase beta chain
MKFTLSWLKTHLETSASAQEIADKLTWIGLEVEEMKDRAASLAPFIIAEIEKAEQHPNADRLRVCTVNTGTEKLQVVCGAPNARAGLRGIFAPPGATIPANGMVMRVSKIRDVESNGMMCSGRELQLSEEGEGIVELPADAPLGQRYADYAGLADPVYEIKLTPNRGDCNGVRGIARDLAAAGLGTLKPLKIEKIKGRFPSPISVKLDFPENAKDACACFIGRYIKNVKNVASPRWLQDRLTAIGLRPISALVDITNLFTFEYGRPLHVFDADKISNPVKARLAAPGEKLLALNGKEYTLDESITVIADAKGVQGVAGIIGGEASGCSETTRNVFLECAIFDPARTTLAGRRLGLQTDARYRFERGVDPGFMADAVELATKLIIELCGGEASEPVTAGAPPVVERRVRLRAERCRTLGGMDVPLSGQQQILEAIGCTVTPLENGLDVQFPGWRPDMLGEADCVEEILRLKGYENIPSVSLPKAHALTASALSPQQKRAGIARRALAARGLLETVTFSFMPGTLATRFGDVPAELRIANPISADLDVMRPSILPNLLQAAARNAARGFADNGLFELGPVYRSAALNGQALVAGGVRTGFAVPRGWSEKTRPVDAFDAKADALAVLDMIKAPMGSAQVTADAPAHYHPGRSGVLRLGPNVLAAFGEIHPAILQQMDIVGAAAGFEIFLDAAPLPKDTGPARPLADLPDLQPVTRDFAFMVTRDTAAATLLKAVRAADKALITDANVFDVYEGKGVPEGQKSVALSITLQPREKPLTDADIEAIAAKVIASAAKAGASLRS